MNRNFLPTVFGYTRRARLHKLLKSGMNYQLVSIIAGPGYGKTLAVADYMRNADVRLIWMHFHNSDNDSYRFLYDAKVAMSREMPELADTLDELSAQYTENNQNMFLDLFTKAAQDGKRIVFVIDDIDLLQNKDVCYYISDLMEADINNFTLVLISNKKMPFAGTFPNRGHFRLTEEELTFTNEEIKHLFEFYGLCISDSEAETIKKDTGGWPLALQLICSERQNPTKPGIERLHVMLAEELFEHNFFEEYSKNHQKILIRSSLFSRFPLQIIKDMRSGFDDEIFHLLIQHPFVSYSHTTEMFTCHKMYHDFLKRKQVMLNEDEIVETYRNAGKWFLENDYIYEAMDSYWQAKDYDAFLEAVWELPKKRRSAEFAYDLIQKLKKVPDGNAYRQNILRFCKALLYFNNIEAEIARKLLIEIIEQLNGKQLTKEDEILLGNTYIVLSDIGMFMNDGSGMQFMKKAAELLPHGGNIRPKSLMVLGNNNAFYLPTNTHGECERMVAYCFELAPYAEIAAHGSGAGYEYLFAAEASYFKGDMDKAEEYAYQAIAKATIYGQHDIVCNTRLLFMRLRAYYGNYKTVKEEFEKLNTYIDENGVFELFELRDCTGIWYYTELGDTVAAKRLFESRDWACMLSPQSMGRSGSILAHYHISMENYIKASAVVGQMKSLFEKRGLWHERVMINVLKAIIHMKKGEISKVEEAFRPVYDMVYQNDLKYPLVEFGKGMVQIVDLVLQENRPAYDERWLAQVTDASLSYAKRQAAMKRTYAEENRLSLPPKPVLTPREDETLRYMAQGLTQEEIGEMMGISANAVKKHVAKIYNKLGAANKADAIHIATVSGLVNVL